MAENVTLDRANLAALVELIRQNGAEHEMPEGMRAGYDMVVEILHRLVPYCPELYGMGGCPDIPDLIGRLAAAEAKLAARGESDG